MDDAEQEFRQMFYGEDPNAPAVQLERAQRELLILRNQLSVVWLEYGIFYFFVYMFFFWLTAQFGAWPGICGYR